MSLDDPVWEVNGVFPAMTGTLLLIVIVVSLNLAAMGMRHRLREKYRALTL